jgi:hypothetical protein
MPRGLRHVALSISFLSPMARRPDALFATNIASLIFLPDLRFLALTSFQSLNGPSFSSGSSSRISRLKQSISVSRPRLRPPGNIHRRSRLLLTNNTRPPFLATSFDDFAITPSAPPQRRIVSANFIPSRAQRKATPCPANLSKGSVPGLSRPTWSVHVTSGLPLIAVELRTSPVVRSVPKAEALPAGRVAECKMLRLVGMPYGFASSTSCF